MTCIEIVIGQILSTLPNLEIASNYYNISSNRSTIWQEYKRRKVFNSQILFNFFDEQGRYSRRSDGCSSCRAYF